jgi:tetratricopeptide (TPR) repeat protein
MSNSLRIEELKKKFDENPRRYFAPLANEYRKAGDLQQAISICQAHLPQQPGHMSGHIVYGQALFEARQFDQARTVFETALALDPENLIALRYLGDIAFELGDRAGARSWYTRVLETDPRNEEIAALMAAMGAEERGAPSRESGPAGVPAEAAVPGEPVRREAVAETAAAAPPRESVAGPVPAEKPHQAPAPSAADAELEKLFSRPAGAAAPAEAAGPAAATSFSPLSGFDRSKASDAAPSLEQPAPSLAAASARPEAPRPPSDGGGRDVGFVTETMAELYLKQGFPDRALGIYRQLVAQNPGDRGLRERMERVEQELRGAASGWSAGSGGSAPTRSPAQSGVPAGRAAPTVRQFLARVGSRGVIGRGPGVAPPPGSGPRNSGEVRMPQGQAARAAPGGSIDALFAGAAPSREDVAAASTLADAFNTGGAGPAASDAPIGGRPAHPAATELSLDHVFREGAGVPPSRNSAGVSYDQFFSQPAQAAAASDEGPSGTTPPAGGSDDIEQFNAWLQGLKKR